MNKKFLYFLLIISSILSISPFVLAQNSTSSNVPAEEIFSKALNNYNQKNYTLAAGKFDSLLKRINISEELEFGTLYYSTMTAVKRYKTNQAVKYLKKFNQAGFQNGNLSWKIGQLFLNKDGQFDSANFNKALIYLKKAENLGLDEPLFKRDLAYAYLENKNEKEAEEIYQNLIKKKPTSADYLNLARIKEKQGQLNKAVEYYEEGRNINGTQSALYLNLANLYQKLNDYDSAISIYAEGIEIQKEFAPLYIGLGESYLNLKKYSEAKKALEKAVEINRISYYGYYLLGNIEKERKNYNEALNYYQKSLENNSDYVKVYLAEGNLYLERGEYYQAIARFSLAVEKNPDYAASHYHLGQAYYQADMKEAAAAEFRKTLHINDQYPKARNLLDQIEADLKNN